MCGVLRYSALLTADRFLQQTTANAQQIRDIEERVQSLSGVLASPICDEDNEGEARREALRRFVPQHREIPSHCSPTFVARRKIVIKLGPLLEQHGLVRFLKNVDHANTLNGFIQDLAYAVVDYQVCVTNLTWRMV